MRGTSNVLTACSHVQPFALTYCRLSVAGILRHPWFRTELPPSLLSLNHDLLDLPNAVRLVHVY